MRESKKPEVNNNNENRMKGLTMSIQRDTPQTTRGEIGVHALSK
mgnify:CR=1 FL=1